MQFQTLILKLNFDKFPHAKKISFANSTCHKINDPEKPSGKPSGILHFFACLIGFRQTEFREQIVELIEKQDNTQNQLDIRERELISNILQMSQISVSDIMTSRGEIIGIDCNQKISVILDSIANNPHSRYPLYHESLDHIIGTIHTKSLYQWLRKSGDKNFDDTMNFATIMKKLIYKPTHVAPSMPVLDLLLHMREGRNHIAFVVDEYGGIAGLVTIEDALEEIVGSIKDEHDVDSSHKISYGKGNSLIMDGRFKLEEFTEKCGELLGLEEKAENLDTIGGLVVYLAGRVPTKGELIPWEITQTNPSDAKNIKIVEFEVLRSLPNRVVQVQLHGLDLDKQDIF